MATGNNERETLTKDERQVVINALDMLITSLVRSEKSAKGATIAQAFNMEATKARAVQNKVASGKLEL